MIEMRLRCVETATMHKTCPGREQFNRRVTFVFEYIVDSHEGRWCTSADHPAFTITGGYGNSATNAELEKFQPGDIYAVGSIPESRAR